MKTNKRDFDIRFRVSFEEKEQFSRLMKSTGFGTFSSFLRYRIFQLQEQIAQLPPTETKKKNCSTAQKIADMLRKEIGKIGVNINQVAKKMNNTHGSTDLKNLAEIIALQQKQIIERPHIHILTTNVKLDGKKINDRFSIRRSIAVCEELEKKYNLIPTIKQSNDEQVNITQKNCIFNIKKGENIKAQIRKITSFVNQNYHFESEAEYRALLRIFAVDAEFVKTDDKSQTKGIVFYGLNNDGVRVTEPIRAVEIQKGLLKKIENKIKKSQQTLTNPKTQQIIKSKLDFVKTADCRVDFYEKLAKKNMDVFFRKNEDGRIFGATIIDHDFGVVANGSKFGKAYSANVFNDLFNGFDNGKIRMQATVDTTQNQEIQHYQESFQNDHALTFSGSFGAGFGHYDRVGDKEEESENDKLNREIEKRKRRLKR